jgi:hypothetical protein
VRWTHGDGIDPANGLGFEPIGAGVHEEPAGQRTDHHQSPNGCAKGPAHGECLWAETRGYQEAFSV